MLVRQTDVSEEEMFAISSATAAATTYTDNRQAIISALLTFQWNIMRCDAEPHGSVEFKSKLIGLIYLNNCFCTLRSLLWHYSVSFLLNSLLLTTLVSGMSFRFFFMCFDFDCVTHTFPFPSHSRSSTHLLHLRIAERTICAPQFDSSSRQNENESLVFRYFIGLK